MRRYELKRETWKVLEIEIAVACSSHTDLTSHEQTYSYNLEYSLHIKKKEENEEEGREVIKPTGGVTHTQLHHNYKYEEEDSRIM